MGLGGSASLIEWNPQRCPSLVFIGRSGSGKSTAAQIALGRVKRYAKGPGSRATICDFKSEYTYLKGCPRHFAHDRCMEGLKSFAAENERRIREGVTEADAFHVLLSSEWGMFCSVSDKIRQDILTERYRNQWRDLEVTYIFGPTATEKTRGVLEKHGYSSVYRVTDYKHPFDRYAQEPVMLLDEFRSSLLVGDMLDYLDGYPLALPARYANRQACYEAERKYVTFLASKRRHDSRDPFSIPRMARRTHR